MSSYLLCSITSLGHVYGGVQFALAHGVPLVVAGGSEDKPGIAMRVAWSGIGVNIKTGTPTRSAIRRSVGEVLTNPRYRRRAAELQAEIAESRPLETISQGLADAVDQRPPRSRPTPSPSPHP
jgi:UDP:flavonoid glycosyltransferase YjiC (YdhE family)